MEKHAGLEGHDYSHVLQVTQFAIEIANNVDLPFHPAIEREEAEGGGINTAVALSIKRIWLRCVSPKSSLATGFQIRSW
jgi:hypothetical protein